jgi:hypothetical protein
MLYAIKTILSALIILIATELSKRSSSLAAFILALPLVSVITLCWIYIESKDITKVAAISHETFWYVLPTLPMFLLIPLLLRNVINFYVALIAACVVTAALMSLTQYLLSKF